MKVVIIDKWMIDTGIPMKTVVLKDKESINFSDFPVKISYLI